MNTFAINYEFLTIRSQVISFEPLARLISVELKEPIERNRHDKRRRLIEGKHESDQIHVGNFFTMCDSSETPTPLRAERIQNMTSIETKEIVTAASAVLARSSVSELRSLRVDEESNELQLHGHVGSFYHKQLAQEAVLPLAGTLQVVNHVDVRG